MGEGHINTMKAQQLHEMMRTIEDTFEPYALLSVDQLYTRCTAKQRQAPLFFRAFAELVSAGRLEQVRSEIYRLKQ
jgi:hypothetical protein